MADTCEVRMNLNKTHRGRKVSAVSGMRVKRMSCALHNSSHWHTQTPDSVNHGDLRSCLSFPPSTLFQTDTNIQSPTSPVFHEAASGLVGLTGSFSAAVSLGLGLLHSHTRKEQCMCLITCPLHTHELKLALPNDACARRPCSCASSGGRSWRFCAVEARARLAAWSRGSAGTYSR